MNEDQTRRRMQQVVELVGQDIGGIRTGRATPSLVENIQVNAYGGQQNLRVVELATITTPDLQTLIITPWDKTVLGEIKRAIEIANIGLSPVVEGDFIRITFPSMTAEDREKYIKLLSQKIENGRIMIRQIRQDEMQKIRRNFEAKEISEDERIVFTKKLQEITDEYISRLDQMEKTKEEQLRQI